MRILLVDDHEMIRRGIRSLLAGEQDYEICGEAVDGIDAVRKAKELLPDLVIMDVSMPRLNGLEATREIRSMTPSCEVVILTQHDSPQMIEKAFEAGARGYVVKTSIARDLLKAVEEVGRHESFVDPRVPIAENHRNRMDLKQLLQRAEALQHELRESEDRFRVMADTAPVLIWMSGTDTLCNYFNKPWLDFTGRTLQQELGNGWAEGVHPEDLGPCIETYLSSFKALKPFRMEYRLRRADGVYRWILDHGIARYLPGGQFAGYIGSCVDITERKEAEDAVREAEERARFRLEAAEMGTWECNLLTGEVQWSATMEKIHQRAPGSFDGTFKSFLEGVHPDDRARVPELLREAVEGNGKYYAEYRQIRADGTIGWVVARGQVFYDSQGQATHIMGTSGDITQRKENELLLLATQKELERLVQDRTAALGERSAQVAQQNKMLELANDAIFLRDTDHTISYWNQGAERLYGWTSQEALGRSAQELLRTQFPIPLAEILSQDHWNGELRQMKRDGTLVTVVSRWVAILDGEGQGNGWLEINTDITDRKRAEDATKSLSGRLLHLQDDERRRIARELHDSAGQYLAGINMALNSIKENTEVLPSEVAHKVAEATSLTEACASEIRTMSHLLHPPLLEELGLASAVRWYVSEFGTRSGIHAQLEISDTLTRLENDVELVLFRVLQESLTNVHRHSGSKTAQVRVGADLHQAWVEVQDQGNGNSARHSFQPGMGIMGMRERVKNFAGVLDITSDQTGSRVKAVIPIATRTPKCDQRVSEKGPKGSSP